MAMPISKNHHFKYLYNKGKQSVSPFFALYIRPNRPNEPQNQNFLGLTVGVKLGNAVTRNKVRRRMREIYRLHESQLKTGFHIVIVARNRCATAQYQEMEQSLHKLFDQIQLSTHPKHPPNFVMGKKENKYLGKKPHNKAKTKNPQVIPPNNQGKSP